MSTFHNIFHPVNITDLLTQTDKCTVTNYMSS